MSDVTDEERLAVARDVIPLVVEEAPPDRQNELVIDLCTPGIECDDEFDVGGYVFKSLIDAVVQARQRLHVVALECRRMEKRTEHELAPAETDEGRRMYHLGRSAAYEDAAKLLERPT